MELPYSSDGELPPDFSSFYEIGVALGEAEAGFLGPTSMDDNSTLPSFNSSQSVGTYPWHPAFLGTSPCNAPTLPQTTGNVGGGMPPVIWDPRTEQDTALNFPLAQSFLPEHFLFSPDVFLPAQNVSYNRTFRGRKNKIACEALSETRPYICDICQAAFARSHDRDRHRRSHTGETPYWCHGCGIGFKRPDARKRHWERDPACAQEDWLRVRHTPEGAKRRARAKPKSRKKQAET